MRANIRTRIFIAAFSSAILATLFITITMAAELSGELQMRLLSIAALAAGGALAGALLISSAIAAPIEERAADILAVARRYLLGDLQRPAPQYGDDEIGEVARAMDDAVRSLGQKIDELSRDRTRMVAILASMVEGVLVVDEHGRIQHVNDAVRRMLKMDHEVVNRHYVEAIRHPGIVQQIKRVLAGEEAESLEMSLMRESRTLVARVAPVVSIGRGAVLVLHDITDLKKADQIRRDFVANVSHELRTPLTAIKGYVEALIDDPADADASKRFLEIIQRHTSRMERLVRDLLRLARIDAGQETPELAPCDVEALIAGLITDFEVAAGAKHLIVRSRVAEPARQLTTDAAKLHDVLRNLIENAVNYTPEQGTIEIAAAVENGRYLITVSDTGPGIPPEDLSRVFERFYRVDKSRARTSSGARPEVADPKPSGTGLGLSIVKNLTHVIGGDVTAVNGPTGGALFTVRLPLREE